MKGVSERSLLAVLALFISCSYAGPAFASKSHISDVIRATSVQSFRRAVQKSASEKRARVGCEAELNAKAIPVSCFEALAFEFNAGSVSKVDRDRRGERLTRICVDRVKSATSWDQLKEAALNKHVSKVCRSESRERLEDLYYQAEADAPSRLLREDGPEFD